MKCKDCVWWNEEHIRLDDGTTRPYTEEERKNNPTGVTADVGINVGATCGRYSYIDNFWMQADDYCSRFEPKGGGVDDNR